MSIRDMTGVDILSDSEIRHELMVTFYVIGILFFGAFAVFTWNHKSFGLGVEILNTPLVKGLFLLIFVMSAMAIENKMSDR
ncbi:MAG: hypothetical protein ACOCYZ_00080 [Halococcoides sp.]